MERVLKKPKIDMILLKEMQQKYPKNGFKMSSRGKCDLYGRLHKDNFERTERIFTKVASFGYIVHYVWESDYKNLKGLQSVEFILREFNGKLEY